jgi:hypothetical protein
MSKDLTPKMRIVAAETEMVDNVFLPSIGQQIGGLSMFSNVFKRGHGNAVFGSDENGIWLGAADFPTAPFRVTMAGAIYAASATFPNLVTITIFKQNGIPTSTAIGDLWFDTDDNNKMYRAGSVGATTIATGQWELVNTVGVQIFAQNGIPTSLNVGDLWYDTDDNNKVYRAASVGADQIAAGEWVLVNDLRAADALLKASSGQTLSGTIEVGEANVKIDGANKRIVINDGVRDIILIGYQSGGF